MLMSIPKIMLATSLLIAVLLKHFIFVILRKSDHAERLASIMNTTVSSLSAVDVMLFIDSRLAIVALLPPSDR